METGPYVYVCVCVLLLLYPFEWTACGYDRNSSGFQVKSIPAPVVFCRTLGREKRATPRSSSVWL